MEVPCGFSDAGRYSRPVQKYSIKLLFFRISEYKTNSPRLKIIFNEHWSSHAKELTKRYFLSHKTFLLSFFSSNFLFFPHSQKRGAFYSTTQKSLKKKVGKFPSLFLEENKVEMPMEMDQHPEIQSKCSVGGTRPGFPWVPQCTRGMWACSHSSRTPSVDPRAQTKRAAWVDSGGTPALLKWQRGRYKGTQGRNGLWEFFSNTKFFSL